MAVFFLLILSCRRKERAKTAEKVQADEDVNPVYGVYYASSGDRIDDGVHEITDENEYYST